LWEILVGIVLLRSALSQMCDYGTGHGFLIFPTDDSCGHFILSHGSAFECPHEYDLKLLVRFEDEDYHDKFCNYLSSHPNSTSNVFGVELPDYGLEMIMSGRMQHLRGPLMINFFSSNMSVYLDDVGLGVVARGNFDGVVYGRVYTADPPSQNLQYLLHVLYDGNIFISHYIAVPPSFDHIGQIWINQTRGITYGTHLLVFPGIPDEYDSRLAMGDPVQGKLMGPGPAMWVTVTLTADLYHGQDDQLVSLLQYCPDPDRPRWSVCPSLVNLKS